MMGNNREPHKCDRSCTHFKAWKAREWTNAYQIYCDCLIDYTEYFMKDVECKYYERDDQYCHETLLGR